MKTANKHHGQILHIWSKWLWNWTTYTNGVLVWAFIKCMNLNLCIMLMVHRKFIFSRVHLKNEKIRRWEGNLQWQKPAALFGLIPTFFSRFSFILSAYVIIGWCVWGKSLLHRVFFQYKKIIRAHSYTNRKCVSLYHELKGKSFFFSLTCMLERALRKKRKTLCEFSHSRECMRF